MRPTHPGYVSYSFGPGPLTPAVRALVILNVAGYLLALVAPVVSIRLGLVPALVFERWWFWQPVTYMFLHGGLFHLLFNMLALWMFGVDLERRWGTRFFARFYFVAGVGAAAATLLLSLLPFGFSRGMYHRRPSAHPARSTACWSPSDDVSGPADLPLHALPDPGQDLRPDHRRNLASLSVSEAAAGVAHVAHLGGLIAGYLYLRAAGRHLSMLRLQGQRWRRASRGSGSMSRRRPQGPARTPGCTDQQESMSDRVFSDFWSGCSWAAVLRVATLSWPGTGEGVGFQNLGPRRSAGRRHTAGVRRGRLAARTQVPHEFDGRNATANYPPAALVARWAGPGTRTGRVRPAGFANTAALTADVKLLPLASDVGDHLAARVRRSPRGEWQPGLTYCARFAALAYWLNPGVP